MSKNGMETNIQKLARVATGSTAKRTPNSKNPTSQQASIQTDQNIAKPPGQQPGSPQLPEGVGGRGEALR